MSAATATPLVLAGPLQDPEAHEPTTSTMVDRALDDATVAAAEAQRHWRRYLDALEQNTDEVPERFADLERAAREARYAYAIYHCARADAAATRVA